MPRLKLQSGERPSLEAPGFGADTRSLAAFVIGCGGKTEASYFNKLVGEREDVIVIALPPGEDNLSSVRQTVDRVNEFWRKHDLEENDQVWIVIDVDDFFDPGNELQTGAAISEAQNKHYHVVISNPCFEVWLLMHTEEVMATFPKCDDLVRHIRLKWKDTDLRGYQKAHLSKKQMEMLRSRIRDAIVRSRRSTGSLQTPPPNPGTDVHLLLEALDNACRSEPLF